MDPQLQAAIRLRMAQRHAKETTEAVDRLRQDNLRLASEQKAIQEKHTKEQAQIRDVLEQQEIARQKQEAALQKEQNYQNALFRINGEFNKLKSEIPTADTDEVATGLVESFLALEHQCKELTILKQEHYSALEYKQLCRETTIIFGEVKELINNHIPEYLTMVLQKIEDEIRLREEEARRAVEEVKKKKEAERKKKKAERIRKTKEANRLKLKLIKKWALYFSSGALVAFLCFLYISTQKQKRRLQDEAANRAHQEAVNRRAQQESQRRLKEWQERRLEEASRLAEAMKPAGLKTVWTWETGNTNDLAKFINVSAVDLIKTFGRPFSHTKKRGEYFYVYNNIQVSNKPLPFITFQLRNASLSSRDDRLPFYVVIGVSLK